MKEKDEANDRKEQGSDSKITIKELGLNDFAVHLSYIPTDTKSLLDF